MKMFSSSASLSSKYPLALVYKIFVICRTCMKGGLGLSQHCDHMISYFVHRNYLRQLVVPHSPYVQNIIFVNMDRLTNGTRFSYLNEVTPRKLQPPQVAIGKSG